MSKRYNLFISHSWAYGEQYNGLVRLLDTANRFEYRNYSVPKDDPVHNAKNDRQLYNAIKAQVSYGHVVIILAGVYSSYSKWINKEIDIAKHGFTNSKPILAIQPWGAERTSTVVKNSADRIVKWNTNSIISAIRDLSR
ncbi:TIR domain-containing protein [Alicyclobacillus sp. SO9]|uniref:TIR domain-containing protein n=1 Tax=Alicyclobacillus sp. SO9 TaxID=2665646 RepID=UPI0018E739EF|nr:TIR domain-containing protein [Alicyclobacillus sp. SO9]QQE77763.1 TIR domain-containing protein [Alicyclobacillus sp. SO9]